MPRNAFRAPLSASNSSLIILQLYTSLLWTLTWGYLELNFVTYWTGICLLIQWVTEVRILFRCPSWFQFIQINASRNELVVLHLPLEVFCHIADENPEAVWRLCPVRGLTFFDVLVVVPLVVSSIGSSPVSPAWLAALSLWWEKVCCLLSHQPCHHIRACHRWRPASHDHHW